MKTKDENMLNFQRTTALARLPEASCVVNTPRSRPWGPVCQGDFNE